MTILSNNKCSPYVDLDDFKYAIQHNFDVATTDVIAVKVNTELWRRIADSLIEHHLVQTSYVVYDYVCNAHKEV